MKERRRNLISNDEINATRKKNHYVLQKKWRKKMMKNICTFSCSKWKISRKNNLKCVLLTLSFYLWIHSVFFLKVSGLGSLEIVLFKVKSLFHSKNCSALFSSLFKVIFQWILDYQLRIKFVFFSHSHRNNLKHTKKFPNFHLSFLILKLNLEESKK